jgi:hypothetical protein
MEPQEHDEPPGGGPTERRWSWPAAVLFIVVCSVLGWLLIAFVLNTVLR